MAKREVHVVPRPDGWTVEGDKRISVKTQKEAVAIGRTMAKRMKTELVIHGRDGRIRAKNSYGKDPFPPKG